MLLTVSYFALSWALSSPAVSCSWCRACLCRALGCRIVSYAKDLCPIVFFRFSLSTLVLYVPGRALNMPLCYRSRRLLIPASHRSVACSLLSFVKPTCSFLASSPWSHPRSCTPLFSILVPHAYFRLAPFLPYFSCCIHAVFPSAPGASPAASAYRYPCHYNGGAVLDASCLPHPLCLLPLSHSL